MSEPLSRREAVKRIAAAGAAARASTLALRVDAPSVAPIVIAGQPVEITVASLSAATVRITISQLEGGRVAPVPCTGALASDKSGDVRVRARQASQLARVRAGDLRVRFAENPPTLYVETSSGDLVQRLTLDAAG